MTWTTTKELHLQVQKFWDKGLLLSAMMDQDSFYPRRLILKTPSSKELSERFDEVRKWIASLQRISGIRIEMQTIRHQVLGENSIPRSAWLDNQQDAVIVIGKQKDSSKFSDLIAFTREHSPSLLPWLKSQPLQVLSLSEEWPRLLAVINWLKAHPKPGIYLRQADIPGVDTKFIEHHRGVLISLLDLSLPDVNIDQNARGVNRFETRYGFLQKPVKVRFRILDPNIRLLPGDSQDITLTREGFHALGMDNRIQNQIKKIFITENETNFLAFPDMRQSIVLFGAGYGFEALIDIKWLSDLQVFYWGDIDTHGFSILNQLRAYLPHAQSILMDEATLRTHEAFWEEERNPESRDLDRLTTKEQQLYNALRDNRIANHLRLEQERIGFKWLLKSLKSMGTD